MNYVIGLCTRNVDWPSTLAELGYKVQIIEQTIGTEKESSRYEVKPDIIAVSNTFIHSLVFECKGGSTIDADQIFRYGTLKAGDINRWVTTYSPSQLSFDVCFADLENNYTLVTPIIGCNPLLTFGGTSIRKTGNFTNNSLNKAFQNPISIKGMHPPLNYYPFSEQDHDAVIVPRILRMIIQIALNRKRGGPSVLVNTTFDMTEVLKQTHPYWKAFSAEHAKTLEKKVQMIIKRILDSRPELAKDLEELENRRGYRIYGLLSHLQNMAEDIIKEMETQQTLNNILDHERTY